MAAKKPTVGDHFRSLDVAWQNEWIVELIRIGTDAHEYAHLRSAFDHTLRKTLALSVLSEPTRFVLVAGTASVVSEQ